MPTCTCKRKETVFSNEFLERLEENTLDHPVSLDEGCWRGPWAVIQHGDRWRVVRDGDGKRIADFELHETAMMFAAVLPIAFRPPIYRASPQEEGMEWTLETTLGERAERGIGTVLEFHDEMLTPLHVVHGVLTDPHALAWILEAAPADAIAQAGAFLARRYRRYRPA